MAQGAKKTKCRKDEVARILVDTGGILNSLKANEGMSIGPSCETHVKLSMPDNVLLLGVRRVILVDRDNGSG